MWGAHFCLLAFSYDIVIWACFFWLLCIFLPECGLSLVAASRGHFLVVVPRFLIAVASPVAGGAWASLLSVWALSRPCAQQLRCTGFVVSWHMEAFQPRDQTHVPCPGRWILIHGTTREVLWLGLLKAWEVFYWHHGFTPKMASIRVKGRW